MSRYFLRISFLFILNSQLLCAQDDVKVPRLNNHCFIPVSGSETPFINSSLMNNIAIGGTMKFNFPLFKINGITVFEAEGNILFLDGGAYYQQRFRDWMAMYIRKSFTARIGTNAQSILTQGITNLGSSSIGWILKISESEKSMLSGNLELSNTSGSIINVADFLDDIIAGDPNARLTRTVPVLTASGGLRYAYAFNDLFGMNFHTEGGLGSGTSKGKTDFWFGASGTFDANFYERFDVPVGLAVSYQYLSRIDMVYEERSRAHAITSKIAYTGSSDFSVGLETSFYSIPVGSIDENVGAITISLVSRFYF